MKIIILLKLFALHSISVFSIPNPDSSNLQKQQELKYLAESYILEENYCMSTEVYNNLYENYAIWNEDLKSALYSSLYCDDKESVERFIMALLERGAPIEFFENELDTFTFFQSEVWEEIKNRKIDYSFDPELREVILEMHKRDQKDRYDVINRMLDDYLNLVELNKITIERGFPNSMELGIDYYKAGLSYNRYFRIILLHLVKLQPWDFGEWLQDLYFKSKISPKDFVYLMAYVRTCDDLQLTCFSPPASNVIFVDGLLFTCGEKKMEKINSNRRLFFLDSVEDQIRKVKFRNTHSEVPWRLGTTFGTYHSTSLEDFESFSKELKEDGLFPFVKD